MLENKILIVDDSKTQINSLVLQIKQWHLDNERQQTKIVAVNDGLKALREIEKDDYNIIFLDINMPIVDGIVVLKKIRTIKSKKDLKVIIVTSLADEATKDEVKRLHANGYIEKPAKREIIYPILDQYIVEDQECEEMFFNFDDFEDFDDFDSEEKDMLCDFNESHSQLSAVDFLKEYPDLEDVLNMLDNINNDISDIICVLDTDNLFEKEYMIDALFEQYIDFLNYFNVFSELRESLEILKDVMQQSDFDGVDKSLAVKYLVAILKDLKYWHYCVFVEQEAIDIFYMNASLLSSCLTLKNIIVK